MAYTDMSAHWVYKDLITYQDLNQLGENDKTHTHDGTITAAINSSADMKQAATKKFYLDGGTETYLVESASDILDIYVGAANIIKITEAAADKVEINAADLEIDATYKFYLDGGSNTYIQEISADKIRFVCGGSWAGDFGSTSLEVAQDIAIGASGKIYFDGIAGHTYIQQVANDQLRFIIGGTYMGDITNTYHNLPTGARIGADAANNNIDDASGGTGSTTLYIGNAAISVASDKRLKTNIENTVLNATEILNKMRVVDFEWDDPSDQCLNNRNARGKWTAMIAQEVVDVLPFVVNAPRIEGKEIDYESTNIWQIEYANIVPVLIKSIQELTARIQILEAK